MKKGPRTPALYGLYHQYLLDQDTARFSRRLSRKYSVGTLERLAATGDRMTRRAAVLALGLVGDYNANATLGRALHDDDRGVRMLADNGIRQLWRRIGTTQHRRHLVEIGELNSGGRYDEAIEQATRLIAQAPWIAEGWNQRAVALFGAHRYAESVHDCTQALEINPYHFGAATGMGQCQLKLNNRQQALECFRRALRLNPNLEGVRAHVLYLQRTLKRQD
ncbi:MAG: tetratricopeptide repeat protein [Pirellulales bacterium]